MAAIVSAIFMAAMFWNPVTFGNPPTDHSKTLENQLHPPASVAAVLQRSCYDCHGNKTRWPWYTHFRPVSDWVQQDVLAGRTALNFSEWSVQTRNDRNLQNRTLETSCASMQAGMMPPGYYLYLHPDAKLTNRDVRAVCEWTREQAATITGFNKP